MEKIDIMIVSHIRKVYMCPQCFKLHHIVPPMVSVLNDMSIDAKGEELEAAQKALPVVSMKLLYQSPCHPNAGWMIPLDEETAEGIMNLNVKGYRTHSAKCKSVCAGNPFEWRVKFSGTIHRYDQEFRGKEFGVFGQIDRYVKEFNKMHHEELLMFRHTGDDYAVITAGNENGKNVQVFNEFAAWIPENVPIQYSHGRRSLMPFMRA